MADRGTVHLIDYDAGNIRSMRNALTHLGAEVIVTGDPDAVAGAERLVVPGVGAFGAAMGNLNARHLVPALRARIEAGAPVLGVCVGFQILFEASEELGDFEGLGLIPGRVRRFGAEQIVPHMGWNSIRFEAAANGVDASCDGHYYFVHSFYPEFVPLENVLATATYGAAFPAVVATGSVLGCQFHPEKSGPLGLRFLERWLESGGEVGS